MVFKDMTLQRKSQPDRRTTSRRSGSRPVLEGVSIFDLIIPWKDKSKEKDAKPKASAKKATQTSLTSFLTKQKPIIKDETEKPKAR